MQPSRDLTTVYHKDEGVISRRVAGETLLVPVKGNLADMQRIFALNEVGEFIWNSLDGKTRLDEIRSRLAQEFEVTAGQAEDDLAEFIASLEQEGLIITQ